MNCSDCGKDCSKEFLTEVNPPGGFGRAQYLVCDDCMNSGEWDEWKKEHWPTWPKARINNAVS